MTQHRPKCTKWSRAQCSCRLLPTYHNYWHLTLRPITPSLPSSASENTFDGTLAFHEGSLRGNDFVLRIPQSAARRQVTVETQPVDGTDSFDTRLWVSLGYCGKDLYDTDIVSARSSMLSSQSSTTGLFWNKSQRGILLMALRSWLCNPSHLCKCVLALHNRLSQEAFLCTILLLFCSVHTGG